jgi:hypothetical protein
MVSNTKFSNCGRCKNTKFFHLGDRVALGGNKTFHSHSDLALLAESKGLLVTSLSKYCKLVIINPNGSKPSHYKKAKELGVQTVMPEEFKKLIKSMCPGNLNYLRNPTFASRLGEGKRVFPLGLTSVQLAQLKSMLKGTGTIIAIQRKKSLSAVVSSHELVKSGRADLFRAWEIPVYDFSKIGKN